MPADTHLSLTLTDIHVDELGALHTQEVAAALHRHKHTAQHSTPDQDQQICIHTLRAQPLVTVTQSTHTCDRSVTEQANPVTHARPSVVVGCVTCVATAFASSVLPLPGGPYSNTPERRRRPAANKCLQGNSSTQGCVTHVCALLMTAQQPALCVSTSHHAALAACAQHLHDAQCHCSWLL